MNLSILGLILLGIFVYGLIGGIFHGLNLKYRWGWDGILSVIWPGTFLLIIIIWLVSLFAGLGEWLFPRKKK